MKSQKFNEKIDVYGSQRDIDIAISELNKLMLENNEYIDRLIIMDMIDCKNIKADILYNGNGIWSKKRILRDIRKALKSKPSKISEYGNGDYELTNYLYKFLTLCCGSIAHYNKYGWIGVYPTKQDFRNFFKHNEFGEDVFDHQPDWKTDCRDITKEILKII